VIFIDVVRKPLHGVCWR